MVYLRELSFIALVHWEQEKPWRIQSIIGARRTKSQHRERNRETMREDRELIKGEKEERSVKLELAQK